MPKIVDGSIACRISYAPESSGRKFYCDHCGGYFDDREYPPCDAKPVAVVKVPEPEVYSGELSDNFEISGSIPIPPTQKAIGNKKK